MGTPLLMQGDCLQLMPHLPPQSVDLILCDLPYGTTQNRWDSGTTGVACANTGREFIGIERDEKYFAAARERVLEAHRGAN